MTGGLLYIVARGANKQATLMHVVDSGISLSQTVCGRSLEGWSRAYVQSPIKVILCKNCSRETS